MDKTFVFESNGIKLEASRAAIIRCLLGETYGAAMLEGVAPISPPVGARHGIPVLGEYWTGQGGWRMAEVKGEAGKPDYHLILACGHDDKPIVLEDVEWGNRGVEIPSAGSHRDGLANTQAMLAAGNSLAKKISDSIACNNHRDCYLPSICELQAIRATGHPLLPTEGYCWSSTQSSAYTAWCQNFYDGATGWYFKFSQFRAFAVRRVLIDSVIQ